MKIFKKFIWTLLNMIKVGGPIQLLLNSVVRDDGWFVSFNSKKSINRAKEPIPWFSYAAIKFIEPRLKSNLCVFEYGCGNSTVWFAERVKDIVSVEHDNEWIHTITPKIPSNAKIIYQPLKENGDYAKECLNQNKKFSIIIIDGRDRYYCSKWAIAALADDGIIIFDNSHTDEYKAGAELISDSGFKRIDFIGLTPIITHQNTTTIFYRPNNCFNI